MSKVQEFYEDGSENVYVRKFNVLYDPLLMHMETARRQPGLPLAGSMHKTYPDYMCISVSCVASDDMTHYIVTARYKHKDEVCGLCDLKNETEGE
jgi:hypothetical protein